MPRVRTFEVIEPPTSAEVWQAAIAALGKSAALTLVLQEIPNPTVPALENLNDWTRAFGVAPEITKPAPDKQPEPSDEPERAIFWVTELNNPVNGTRSLHVVSHDYDGTVRIGDNDTPAQLAALVLHPNETAASVVYTSV